MRKWLLSALSALTLTLAGGDASAQVLENPWAVRVGALLLLDDDVRNATDNTWVNLGVDYLFKTTDEGHDWIGALDFGSASGANYWAFQGIHMWRSSEGLEAGPFSFGLGGGVYFLDSDFGDTSTEFGVPLVAEWAFTDQFFLQAKYHWVVSSTNANALGLTLGYDF